MLLVAGVKENRRKALPEDYNDMEMKTKLYQQRSEIPAVTHVDFSARVQTVHREVNPDYWKLLNAFKDKTGNGMLVNTSFNVRDEPIVCSPDDAINCFLKTEMDGLVLGDFLVLKEEQEIAYL